MFKIGNVEIKGKVICAPMAGVTNMTFRKLVQKHGAALTCTEMVSNVALKYNPENISKYAIIGEGESPVALQIFGGDVEDYVNAAKFFDKNSSCDIIDINMGCPVKKVAIKSQAGSALIKTPDKIRQIIRNVVKEIKKPLTIKIRIGWDEKDLSYLEVAKIAEAEGASAIAVHGRTREQMYTGKANWQAIKEIKKTVSIPVIGNGDVKTPEDVLMMLEETGVDAVMVARAAQKYPFIFEQMNDFLVSGKYNPIMSLTDMKTEIHNFYEDLKILKGSIIAFKELKGYAGSWLSNYNGIKSFKNDLMKAPSIHEFFKILDSISIKK